MCGGQVEPACWRTAYQQRHALQRDWVCMWEREERFQHGRHGEAAPLSNALRAAQQAGGGWQHRVRPLTRDTGAALPLSLSLCLKPKLKLKLNIQH